MTPPNKNLGDDLPVWGLEPNGIYSVKSGYILALGLSEEPNRVRWSAVWKWEGPQRVRHFLWIVSNNKLLTNAERYRRHITNCGDCGVCLGTPESSLHVLRDCAASREVWDRFQEISSNPDFYTMNMEAWWESNISKASTATSFGLICWVLWKCRNERIFEGFTLNTDGSVLQPSGLAAAGGALRNWEGRIVDAFTINLGKCSITRAELTGAVMGMERAWDVGVRELTVQLDSLCAIKLLSDPGGTDHQHACIVERFRALMSRAWQVRILHIFRKGNFLADHLANRGHEASLGLHVIDLSDHLLLHWARYDSVGGSETRRIVI
ncbi:Putative ribonuclease H protein At1g65750 [Linum perenne]